MCIQKVPESLSNDGNHSNHQDWEFVTETLQIPSDSIDAVFRSGPRPSEEQLRDPESPKIRPLIVKLKSRELAVEWCKGRIGKKVSGYYINADLCRADRIADFHARTESKKRKNNAQPTTDQTETATS